MSVELQGRQFTIKEYHQMAESGILKEENRVELIAGEIIQMTLIGIPHAIFVRRIEAFDEINLTVEQILG